MTFGHCYTLPEVCGHVLSSSPPVVWVADSVVGLRAELIINLHANQYNDNTDDRGNISPSLHSRDRSKSGRSLEYRAVD